VTPHSIHERAKVLFEAALQVAPGQREAWLRDACEGDEDLVREIVTLLGHHDDRPLLPGVVAHVLAEVLDEACEPNRRRKK